MAASANRVKATESTQTLGKRKTVY